MRLKPLDKHDKKVLDDAYGVNARKLLKRYNLTFNGEILASNVPYPVAVYRMNRELTFKNYKGQEHLFNIELIKKN